MELKELISPARIHVGTISSSKKRLLEDVSELVCTEADQESRRIIFDTLFSRERLGTTGLGHGVAIPHGRLRGCKQSIGAFIRLQEPLDYNSADGQPVDLVFGLLVPEESNDDHLKILARIARLLGNADLRSQLRQATTPEAIYQLLIEHDTQSDA